MPEQFALFDLPKMDGPGPRFSAFHHRIWTENKARLIERYLFYFVLITRHGAYIDGFAGRQYEDKPDAWAAKLVLESEPRWLRNFYFCDRDSAKVENLKKLRASQIPRREKEPKRTVEIFDGDFNQAVNQVLKSEDIRDRTATFCLLDQHTFECHWRTVEVLAARKPNGFKIEQFYFLATGWLDRAMKGTKNYAVLRAWLRIPTIAATDSDASRPPIPTHGGHFVAVSSWAV